MADRDAATNVDEGAPLLLNEGGAAAAPPVTCTIVIGAGKDAHTTFMIGARAGSAPSNIVAGNSKDVEEVAPVVLKTCVCCGNSSMDENLVLNPAALSQARVKDDELRPMICEVSTCLKRRSYCSWGWGWLGPLMLIIWWLDMLFGQCCCGLTQCIKHRAAVRECRSIVDRYAMALEPTGVHLKLQHEMEAISSASCLPVWFHSFRIQVTSSR